MNTKLVGEFQARDETDYELIWMGLAYSEVNCGIV
jgi:hypothetical protein